MIATETKEVIDQYYQNLKNRDRDGLLKLLSNNITVIYYGQDNQLPWAGTFNGIPGFDEFFSIIAHHLEIVNVQQEDFICNGNKVVVQCNGCWKVKKSGSLIKGGMVNVFTVEEEQIIQYEVYADTAAFASAMKE